MLTQALDVGFGPRLRARRLRQLIVTAASTALMLTWSAGPAAALYYDFCSPNFAAIHKTWTINTEVSPSYNISGSLANVRVRSISPCTQNGIVADQSFVPVTLQYDGTEANKDKIVQIGYSKCGASGGCNDIPSDLKPHFWYTKSDTGSGLAWLADGWYKAPVIGDEYRMKVEAISSGGSKWQYCIRDVNSRRSVHVPLGGPHLVGRHVRMVGYRDHKHEQPEWDGIRRATPESARAIQAQRNLVLPEWLDECLQQARASRLPLS